jgi:NAD(P)-dependent dehydrogenase (short-subunit alcohol dehydrogenase family)
MGNYSYEADCVPNFTGMSARTRTKHANERGTVMARLDGKIAIVTGAAGGIGGAIARSFLAEGAEVLAIDIRDGGLSALENAAEGRARVQVCDVSSEDEVAAAVNHAVDAFGGLDVIVNNAVFDLPLAPLTAISLADWRRTWAVNMDGAFLLSRAAIPLMEKRGGGSIIHVASQLGRVAKHGRPWYCAQKGALINLAKAMALDHAAAGIRVNCLSPGPVETDRYLRNFESRAAAQATANTMLGRLGTPDEIAAGAVFLASDESSFMTGADLLIDGGYTAW